MDDKYNLKKSREPETKSEQLQRQIEELVKKRDAENDPAAEKKLNGEIMRLFAQYQRSKL